MLTVSWISWIIAGADIGATAAAPGSSAILACSAVTTSMITPPLSISASPALTVKVASSRPLPLCALIRIQCSRAIACGAMPEAVFQPYNGGFRATELARGPWDPGAQHGGAPAAV